MSGYDAPHPPYPPPYPPRRRADGMAIASLVLGIAGLAFACLGVVASILAVVFGHVALARIAREGATGRGMAVTGLITGYIGIAIQVILLILFAIGTFSSPPLPS